MWYLRVNFEVVVLGFGCVMLWGLNVGNVDWMFGGYVIG